jgi:hypothetical protein
VSRPRGERGLTSRIKDAAGSDDAFGYPGIDRDGVAGPGLVVAGEHVGRDGEDHRSIGDRQYGVRHRTHRTALHAAVVIGSGRNSIIRPVLGVHRVMVVFAVTGGLIVMARDAGTMLDAGYGRRRQLQRSALLPSRRAGDQRERDGQNDDMAKNTTHQMMLAAPTESRHRNVLAITGVCGATLALPVQAGGAVGSILVRQALAWTHRIFVACS